MMIVLSFLGEFSLSKLLQKWLTMTLPWGSIWFNVFLPCIISVLFGAIVDITIIFLCCLSSVRARLRRLRGTPAPPPTASVARPLRIACGSLEERWVAAPSTEVSWEKDARLLTTDPRPHPPCRTTPRLSRSLEAADRRISSRSWRPSSREGKRTLYAVNARPYNRTWKHQDMNLHLVSSG